MLLRLKVRKTSGPDNIPARVLREVAESIAPSLSAFFNRSLMIGEVPTDWKTTHVAPIFKRGTGVRFTKI